MMPTTRDSNDAPLLHPLLAQGHLQVAVQLDHTREQFQGLLAHKKVGVLLSQYASSAPSDRRVVSYNAMSAVFKFVCFLPCVSVAYCL